MRNLALVDKNQGAPKGGRQKEFDHLFVFGDSLVTFWSLFSDVPVTFFVIFFAKLLLPDSFCCGVKKKGFWQNVMEERGLHCDLHDPLAREC